MTEPRLHTLPPDVSRGLRGALMGYIAGSTMFMVLFTGIATLGARTVYDFAPWPFGALLAGAFLIANALSFGILFAARRGRHAVVADTISITVAGRSQTIARRCSRLGRIAAALSVVAVLADAFLQSQRWIAMFSIPLAGMMLPTASAASALDRLWAEHLPNETPS